MREKLNVIVYLPSFNWAVFKNYTCIAWISGTFVQMSNVWIIRANLQTY